MKKHLVWIIALLAGLFSSCLIDREAEARAEQNLQEVGELYHTEKSICDSLLDVATSYYLPDLAKGDTTLSSLTSSPQQAECMLYEGILHHDRAQELRPDIEAYTAEMAKAYRLFLEVERNVELLPDSYLKGVVNDRMACLYLQNGKKYEGASLKLRGITTSQINSRPAFLVYLTFKLKNSLRYLEENL